MKAPTIKKLSLDVLVIDPLVQRVEGVDQTRVDKMATNFQAHQLGVFVVSQRSDGRCVVLDGMHRLTLCRQVGYTAMVNTEVFTDLTIADEAALFLGRNNAKMPSAISKFHARVLMGEVEANEIHDIAAEHQWQIAANADPGHIAAIDALERVYRNGGGTVPEGRHPELLSRTLEILTAAWEWDVKSVHQSMLLAVAQLIGRFGSAVDTKKLIEEMQQTRPNVVLGRGKTMRDLQGGSLPAALAKILAGMHNRKRRTNLLPEWVWIR